MKRIAQDKKRTPYSKSNYMKVSLSNRNFLGIKLRWVSGIHETEYERWTVFNLEEFFLYLTWQYI